MPTNSGTTPTRGDQVCSFCGKAQASVKRLIAGPGRVFICDECVHLCEQIITEEGSAAPAKPALPSHGLSPKEIYARLNEYVVGQERAKRVLDSLMWSRSPQGPTRRDHRLGRPHGVPGGKIAPYGIVSGSVGGRVRRTWGRPGAPIDPPTFAENRRPASIPRQRIGHQEALAVLRPEKLRSRLLPF